MFPTLLKKMNFIQIILDFKSLFLNKKSEEYSSPKRIAFKNKDLRLPTNRLHASDWLP